MRCAVEDDRTIYPDAPSCFAL